MRRNTLDLLAVSLTSQPRGPSLSPALAFGRWLPDPAANPSQVAIDVRGFYRDLEALRGLGVEIVFADDNRYSLVIDLDEALARLPFPDPGLNFRDVQQLAKGETAAHRKLKRRLNSFLGNGTRSANPNKPR